VLLLAVLAGFIASVAMVLAFAVAYAFAVLLGRLPIPVVGGWFDALTHNQFIDTAGPVLYEATAVFLVGGVIWSAIYGVFFEPRLNGPAWRKGVTFGLIPWLFSLLIVMPLIGGGPFGLGLGAGPLPIIGNFVLHLVYGAILGTVYGTAESVFDRPRHLGEADDLLAGRLHELGAARGLAAGLILGIILGALGSMVMPLGSGINPLAMVLGLGLTGAAFGGFVGSLSTA
jgi:hypothetical protein